MSGMGNVLTFGNGMLAVAVWIGVPGIVGEDITAVLT